jgi:hypothetical protein
MDREAYRKKLKERAELNRKAFEGQYKDELKELLGLSRDEIDKITPDTTDLETYSQLITIVKEASAANIDQAELVSRIKALGSLAISIAKHVPKLATLFV